MELHESPIEDLLMEDLDTPSIQSKLRHNIVKVPRIINRASGIVVNGRRIKSLLFSTDLAIIQNCNADAVFCVYPFTAQRSISSAIIRTASAPVFCGVGGGTTHGIRTVYLATGAEAQGAMGVVLNAPIHDEDISMVAHVLDIPIVVTAVSEKADIGSRIEHGASIINVAAGARTPDVVAKIRADFPRLAIMASGGKTDESIRDTIEAGANAIVYTPPSASELFRSLMSTYRDKL